MTPANSIDLARIRKFIDLAEDHMATAEVGIYVTNNYLSITLVVKKVPAQSIREIMNLPVDQLINGKLVSG